METNSPQRVDLTALRKKQFLIDLGDGVERIIGLNTSDINIVSRLSESEQTLSELDTLAHGLQQFANLDPDDENVNEKLNDAASKLHDLDKRLKETLDYIFDSNVSEICCPFGSMYDPVGGKLRYEYIMEALMQLYGDTITKEMDKVTKRMNKHTAKYTGKH